MQPVIEVQCPFCKVRGQIVTPPVGSIIVGPCPQCAEIVLLFCGVVLPLNKDAILHGTVDEKKTHLTETIMELVTQRITELVENAQDSGDEALVEEIDYSAEELDENALQADEAVAPVEADAAAAAGKVAEPVGVKPSCTAECAVSPISDDEVHDFVNIDLHLIDRKEYFERVFGKT